MSESQETISSTLMSSFATFLPFWLINGVTRNSLIAGAVPLALHVLSKVLGRLKFSKSQKSFRKHISLSDKSGGTNRIYSAFLDKVKEFNSDGHFEEILFDAIKTTRWEHGESLFSSLRIESVFIFDSNVSINLYGHIVEVKTVNKQIQIGLKERSCKFLEVSSSSKKDLEEVFSKLYEDTKKKFFADDNENGETLTKIRTYEVDPENKEWFLIPTYVNKTFENTPIDEAIHKDVIRKIKKFYQSGDYYTRTGQPYKMGFLFHGKPGTGKSSFILALANEFKKRVYYAGNELFGLDFPLKTMMDIRPGSFLVFEDIDLAIKSLMINREKGKTENDENEGEADPSKPDPTTRYKNVGLEDDPLADSKRLALRKVLRVLDGYSFLYGVIVIFTTNVVDDIDSALIRHGRIDHCYKFGNCTQLQMERIGKIYGLNGAVEELKSKGITSAELINRCKTLAKIKSTGER